MFCTKCGNQLDENTKFCTYCGEINPRTSNAESPKNNYGTPYMANNNQMYSSNPNQSFNNMQGQPQYTPNNMQQIESPMYHANYSQPYSNSNAPKKKSPALLIVIISVVVLLIVGAVLFFVFKDKLLGKKEPSTDSSNSLETNLHNPLKNADTKQEEPLKNKPEESSDNSLSSEDNDDIDDSNSDYDRFDSSSEDDGNNYESDVEEFNENEPYEPENNTDSEYYYNNDYMLPGSDSRYISEEELYTFDAYMCKIARNELYARHGRLFDNPDLQDYFNHRSWYYGYLDASDFNEALAFNKYEKANIKLITKYEKKMGYRK